MLAECGENPLHPTLGVASLTALGVGGIIGTGIFVLHRRRRPRRMPGPAVILSFIIAGARLRLRRRSATRSSPRPCRSPGSAYTYAYATLGEFVAWVIGWDLILEDPPGAAHGGAWVVGNLVTLLGQLGMQILRPQGGAAAPRGRSPGSPGGALTVGDGGGRPHGQPPPTTTIAPAASPSSASANPRR